MKKLVFKSSILLLVFSVFMTSCQKEEIADTEIAKIETEQVEAFTRLIYNNESFSTEEVNTNSELASLLEKPTYYMEDITNGKQEILKFVFDTKEEADISFENGEVENNFAKRGINVRVAVEFFKHTNLNDKIHRRVIYLNNFNYLYNQNLPGWAINSASSTAFRVTGLPNDRKATIALFDRARQQDLLGVYDLYPFENGQLFAEYDFRTIGINDKLNSYRVNLSAY